MEFHVFDLTGPLVGHTQAQTYQRHLHQLELAEQGGMDGYWFAEHHFDAGFNITPSPNLLLAVAATQTTRIRLGNMCNIIPYHHPIRMAEEIRMLDLMSDGRLDVGLGRGSLFHEQRGWGVERDETYERFEVGWELMRQFLTETNVEYESNWYRGQEVTITPEATQLPYPPMWLAAVSETTFEKAARLGMNCVFAFRNDRSLREKIDAYRAAWDSSQPGVTRGKFMVMCHLFVAETEEEARKFAKPQIDKWLVQFLKVVSDRPIAGETESYRSHAAHREAVLSLTYDDLIQQNLLVIGTPDQCTAQLEQMASAGIDAFQGWMQFGELDPDAADRSIKLFCQEVMPRLRHSQVVIQ